MNARALVIGGLGGVAVGLVVWLIAKRQLQAEFDKGARQLRSTFGRGSADIRRQLEAGREELRAEIRRQLDTTLPATVQREMTATLNRYGITPTTGARIDRALRLVERTGIL